MYLITQFISNPVSHISLTITSRNSSFTFFLRVTKYRLCCKIKENLLLFNMKKMKQSLICKSTMEDISKLEIKEHAVNSKLNGSLQQLGF